MPAVLITGANRGLGLEFVRQYQADGWEVIALAREPGSELAGTGVRIEQLDMRDLEAVTAFGRRLGADLDVLIANAGTWEPETSQTAEDGRKWAEMMVVNCIAPVLLARSLAPLVEKRRGKMIAITSQMGSIGDNRSGGYLPYRSTKAALNAAWKSLAIELRPRGIAAAVLHPGWVKTRMGGPNAPLQPPESIAGMRRVIEGLTVEGSGRFFNYDGREIEW